VEPGTTFGVTSDDPEGPRSLVNDDIQPQPEDIEAPRSTPTGGEDEEEGPKYKDALIAFAFFAHMFLVFLIMILTNAVNDNSSESTALTDDERGAAYPQICCSIFIGVALSWLWLQIMKRCPGQVVYFCFISACVLMFAFAVLGFIAQNWFVGVTFLILFLFFCCYVYTVWGKINFSTEMMKETFYIINEQIPQTTNIAYLMTLVFLVWCIIWGAAVFGCIKSNDTAWLTFFLVLFLLWAMEVVKYVVSYTTSRCFFVWYRSMTSTDDGSVANTGTDNPVRDALLSALTINFGSICLGALFVALVETINFVIVQWRTMVLNNSSVLGFLKCCTECLTNCIEGCLSNFNKHAFVICAMTKDNFWQSSEKVEELFTENHMRKFVEDDLVGGILIFAVVMVGILDAIIVGSWAWAESDGWHGMYVGFIGGLIGFAMATVTMAPVESGLASLYVLYADSPAQLYNPSAPEGWRFRKLFREMKIRHEECAKDYEGVDVLPSKFNLEEVPVAKNHQLAQAPLQQETEVKDSQFASTPDSPPETRTPDDTPAPAHPDPNMV